MKEITRLGQFYKKYLDRIVPAYAIFSLITCFALNSIIYFGSQRLMAGAKHYDLSIPLDEMIPFQPYWIFIYVFCYVEWTIGYIVISRQGKEHWFQFALADMMSRLICGAFFILLPTTIIRPEITGSGISDMLVKLIYTLDPATNLFPSIHCLVSWLCFVGVRKSKNVPKWYKFTMSIYAFLVFVSVVTLKQHVVVDIFAGVIIAEICYYISYRKKWYQKLMKIFDSVNKCILGKKYNE